MSQSCERWTGSGWLPNERGTIFLVIFRRTLSSCWPSQDEPLGAGRRETVAVLFADIVAFTRMAELMAPEDVLAILREFHTRMTAQIFASGGTVDQYMGDGILAVFGAPAASSDDAASALNCAEMMLETLERWNHEREEKGDARLDIGIGLNYGPVVLGDVGSEHGMSFTAIGDTVNTSARLQVLTRSLKTQLVVGDAVVRAIQALSPEVAAERIGRLEDLGEHSLRGRASPVRIWTRKVKQISEAAPFGRAFLSTKPRSERHSSHWHLHRAHVLVQVVHDPERPDDDQKDDQDAERQRQDVVDVVGPGGDVQEEDQVHADLSDRQHHQRDRNAGVPNQGRPGDKERHRRQQDRQAKAYKIANDAFRDLVASRGLVAGSMVGAAAAADSRPSSSCACSEKIDHREDRDPDDVERVPEQREAEDATQNVGAIALGEHLRDHRQQP